ncbi:AMP-binding enzyme family protein (macronuclear) [Tetrahymena thermophila SB210]|uniref:AMP-binding enzyme family protein n=1 Tax=Tetrahymena thermophila (strain SB210) TaxID=312017 RepID=W7XDV9_TETTS|nr:AMP-binding enzyme family protein [Tetrahymena thermophila SB210]EWS72066.1 AMP-binding enzyme family protein [Tetrahymena thermophila SB210]|eukprot:XP_012655377.1 AMP-binding enzyme family protein [Tetrahymena thermophila SB210]
MTISKLDLFSSYFYFNIRGSSNSKGTLFGSILSLLIITITISYLCYLFQQYFTNQIEPNYRSQSFTNSDSISMDLTEDLIAFRYESEFNLSVDVLEAQQNKTYIVYLAQFIYMNQGQQNIITLNVVQCTSPELEGYYCLDYSPIKTSPSFISDNINKILTQVYIFLYGCLDLDSQKTTIPDNCASQSDIDNLMNSMYSALKISIKTSQYNTKSQRLESSYRNSLLFTLSNQFIQSILKVQKQTTTVKQGLLIQSSTNFTSPLQYTSETQSLDRQSTIQLSNLACYAQGTIQVDELYQEIYIQYPTIPTILSLANSIFQVLMLLGFVARRFSMSSINKELFVILLQSIYQDTYFRLLKSNNLIDNCQEEQKQLQINNNQLCQNQTDESEIKNIDEKNNDETQEKQNNMNRSIFLRSVKTLDMQHSINKKVKADQNFKQDNKYSEPPKLHQIFKKIQQQQNYNLSNDEDSMNKSNSYFQNSPIRIKNEKNVNNSSFFYDHNQIQNSTILQQFQDSNQTSQSVVKLKNHNITQDNITLTFNKCLSFQMKLCQRQKSENDPKTLNDNQKKKIQNIVEKDFDIFQFYKDILFLKKAVMILLDEDQLAALQQVGCSDQFFELDLKELEKDTNNLDNLCNHYEKQYAISLSDELQNLYLKNFYEKFQNKKKLNNTDKKIMSSIQTIIKI